MRKIIKLFILSLFVFQFAYAQEVAINPNEWDFGKIKQNQIYKHDFIFKNETNAVLNITSVNTSCGCTASRADKKSLQPGESATINIAFNSHGYVGAVKQSIYVNTDNVELSVVKFAIKCEVIK